MMADAYYLKRKVRLKNYYKNKSSLSLYFINDEINYLILVLYTHLYYFKL